MTRELMVVFLVIVESTLNESCCAPDIWALEESVPTIDQSGKNLPKKKSMRIKGTQMTSQSIMRSASFSSLLGNIFILNKKVSQVSGLF